MLRVFMLVLILFTPTVIAATEYKCNVDRKFDFEHVYTSAEIEKQQFSILIDEKGKAAFVSRCSFA